MRLDYMSADACKARAKRLENPNAKKEYRGLAVLRVAAVRLTGADVVDSRINFCGHADIKLGIPELTSEYIPEEPYSPELTLRLHDFANKFVASSSRFYPDPNTQLETWVGGTLTPP
jgi:hypothetical protein